MTFELLIFSISCSCVFCMSSLTKKTKNTWAGNQTLRNSEVMSSLFDKKHIKKNHEQQMTTWETQKAVRLLMPFEFLMLLIGSQKFLVFFLIKATHNFRDSHDFCFCCSWFVFFKATHDFWVSHVFIPCSFFCGFSKNTHDCCISHVVICCSWVFSVCFFNWLLMIFELLMCFLLLMPFEFLMLSFVAHELFIFMKAAHDFWVSHVFISCSFF